MRGHMNVGVSDGAPIVPDLQAQAAAAVIPSGSRSGSPDRGRIPANAKPGEATHKAGLQMTRMTNAD